MFNDKLLISCRRCPQLFCYNGEGRHLSTITIVDNDKLFDATWTQNSNIVYTIYESNKVVVMSETGKVSTMHTHLTVSESCIVSIDGILYLAESEGTGVYQSTDDGVGWSLVFKATNDWYRYQVIKVITDHSNDFWTMESYCTIYSPNCDFHLRAYSVDRKRSDNNVTWRDINVTTTDGEKITLSSVSSLSYDMNMNIFLSNSLNKTVHVFSIDGQYQRELLSSRHIKNYPSRLAVDKKRQLLYVGQGDALIQVFKLVFEVNAPIRSV